MNLDLTMPNGKENFSQISDNDKLNISDRIAVPYLAELILVRQLTQTWLVPPIVILGIKLRLIFSVSKLIGLEYRYLHFVINIPAACFTLRLLIPKHLDDGCILV